MTMGIPVGDTDAWLVALYGKPYMQAAQSAWHLLRDRGIDALVNDSLVGMSKFPWCLAASPACLSTESTSSHLGRICSGHDLLTIRVPLSAL